MQITRAGLLPLALQFRAKSQSVCMTVVVSVWPVAARKLNMHVIKLYEGYKKQ